jgi:PKD repeat protein
MEDVKGQVKEAVKQFTKDYVSEVVKESTKKLLKQLTDEKKATLESELKNRSAEDVERYLETNSEINNAFESTVNSIREASLEKIQTNFEISFVKYLPQSPQTTPQTTFGRIVRWFKKHLNVGIVSIISIAIIAILLFALPNNPLIAIANGPYSETVNVHITFTGSASGGTPPYSYSWDFGDGASSSLQNPTHAYSSVGTYTAILTVTDSAGRTAQDNAQATVASPIVAVANGPYSGNNNIPIAFTGSASGGTPPYSYSWDFGDGASSSLQNPTHAYSNVGTYTAILTVTDSAGRTAQDNAQVTIAPQLIAIPGGPYYTLANYPVSFSGSASGGTPPYSYSWDFGDGASSPLQNPSHSYSNTGTYTAILTVTDSAGRTAQNTTQAQISILK